MGHPFQLRRGERGAGGVGCEGVASRRRALGERGSRPSAAPRGLTLGGGKATLKCTFPPFTTLRCGWSAHAAASASAVHPAGAARGPPRPHGPGPAPDRRPPRGRRDPLGAHLRDGRPGAVPPGRRDAADGGGASGGGDAAGGRGGAADAADGPDGRGRARKRRTRQNCRQASPDADTAAAPGSHPGPGSHPALDEYLDGYAARTVAAGAAALGFGIAPVHDTVPRALVAACDRHGLPLVEVPAGTPFTAVESAVWQAVTEARHRELTRLSEAQRALAAAAARPDPAAAVLRALARHVHGWTALLAPDGADTAPPAPAPAPPSGPRPAVSPMSSARAARPRPPTPSPAAHCPPTP